MGEGLPQQHGHEHGAAVFPLGIELCEDSLESDELCELDQVRLDIELLRELGLDHELGLGAELPLDEKELLLDEEALDTELSDDDGEESEDDDKLEDDEPDDDGELESDELEPLLEPDEPELAEEGTVADERELELEEESLEEPDEAEEKVGDEVELALGEEPLEEADEAEERRLVADEAELWLALESDEELALEPLDTPIEESELLPELGELALEPDELSLEEFELEAELSLEDDAELALERELLPELGDEGELGGVAEESELDGDEPLLDDDDAELPDDEGELPLEADDELALEADDGLPADEAELRLEAELGLEPDDDGELLPELEAELSLDGGNHGCPDDEAELGLEGAAPALEAEDEGELPLESDELALEALDAELASELLMRSASHRINECCIRCVWVAIIQVSGALTMFGMGHSHIFRSAPSEHTVFTCRHAARCCANIYFCQIGRRYLTLSLLWFFSRRPITRAHTCPNTALDNRACPRELAGSRACRHLFEARIRRRVRIPLRGDGQRHCARGRLAGHLAGRKEDRPAGA